MNGLEAVKFMEKGNMVQNERCIYKIKNGNVLFKIKLEEGIGFLNSKHFNLTDNCEDEFGFLKSKHFDFTDNYEEYVEPNASTGWERSNYKSNYFYIHSNGVSDETDIHNSLDLSRFKNANYFSTKEKANEIYFKQTLFRKLQRFSDENGGLDINWKNGLDSKWYIYFDYHSETLEIYSLEESRDFWQVYFSSRKVAEKAMELFHDDLIKYFTYDWREQDGN